MTKSDAGVIGIIGGTGLGQALLSEVRGERVEVGTPFGSTSAPIVRACWEGVEIAFLPRHGEDHTFCPTSVPYRANVYAMKSLGVTRILASGATGSLREEIRPRDLVIPDQVIDRTTRRSGTFFETPGIVVHVESAGPFCPALRQSLLTTAKALGITVHDGGTYVCMEGPAFSTIAESRVHRAWGGDLIGMTCMPEARLCREAEICYALIALPTDYDCWRPHDPSMDKQTLLAEILANVDAATENCVALVKAALRSLAEEARAGRAATPCDCRNALNLAIWTRRESITRETASRYGVLLSRYFPE